MKKQGQNDKFSYEASELVDKMARTLADLYYFIAKEVSNEFGEKGKEAIKRAVLKYGEYRGKKIRNKVLSEGLPLTVANLMKYYDLPLSYAWKSEKIRNEENYLEKKVCYCPFAEEWKQFGGEELGLIYCLQDEALRKAYNHELIFRQFTNLQSKDRDCHTILKKQDD